MLCTDCANASDTVQVDDEETQAELESLMQEMKQVYEVVLFCTVKQAVVVGNPGKPTQDVVECEDYTSA